jgi:hypothetical protein
MHHESTSLAETWRPIPGYEGIYAVSDRGSVRRELSRGRAGEFLKPVIRNGYPCVLLSAHGTHRWYDIHVLVAAAFIGPIPSGYQVNQIDGIKTHNWPSNLEFRPRPSTTADAATSGLTKEGVRQARAKLTDDAVRGIRALGKSGLSYERIAARFGVSRQTVSLILHGKTWRHVK